jgi:hypothetical protein
VWSPQDTGLDHLDNMDVGIATEAYAFGRLAVFRPHLKEPFQGSRPQVLVAAAQCSQLTPERGISAVFCGVSFSRGFRAWPPRGRGARHLQPLNFWKKNQKCTSQSQSYVTTDGQSASLSWCQVPIGTQGQIIIRVRQLRVC